MSEFDTIDHIALPVEDIARAVKWYRSTFACEVVYEDASWAMLRFGNVKLAFVLPEQHPPHLGFVRTDADAFGSLKAHRDGSRSAYIRDSEGNAVEILAVDRELMK